MESEIDKILKERDYWEEKATELANDVALLLDFDVGEHTSENCPVQNAIDQINEEVKGDG